MTDLLSSSRAAFLSKVGAICPASRRGVNFAGILDALTAWSEDPSHNLSVRKPGKQDTVSYAMNGPDHVLWAAYPLKAEGAKVVVLPKRFRRLPPAAQRTMLRDLKEIAPDIVIPPTGLLQLPLHLLAHNRELSRFSRLLSAAREYSLKHH